MKINVVLTTISVLAAALLGYLYYTLSSGESEYMNTLAISGSFSAILSLECGLGISWKSSHYQVNIYATSILFLIFFIIEHCCFAIWTTQPSWIIITTGLLSVIYILITYSIIKSKI